MRLFNPFSPFLAIFLLLYALLVTGCVEDKQTAARTISVSLDSAAGSDLSPHLEASVYAAASEVNVPVVIADETDTELQLKISLQSSDGPHLEAPLRYWGVFTGFWSELEGIELATIQTSSDLYLPLEYKTSLTALIGDIAATARWLPASEATTAVMASNGLTILPLESADPRLRSIALAGSNLLRDADTTESLLIERAWLTWTDPEVAAFAEALARRLSVARPGIVRLLATGDIIPARCVYARQAARDDYTSALKPVAPVLQGADITAGSLDAAISDAATPIGCEVTFNLLAPARSVEGLSLAGFDVMSVATNHIKDCGRSGFCGNLTFNETLANLRQAGIEPVGGGANLSEARKPVIIERQGVRFAFLAYDDVASEFYGAGPASPGTAPLTLEGLQQDIASARLKADVVIVMPQWGVEYEIMPTSRQQELARVAIEAGADLVLGNHPHVVQAVEWLDDAFIAYALGNFVFDQDWSLETQQGMVLEAIFVGARLAEVRLIPSRIIDMHQATFAGKTEARSILGRVRLASSELK